MPAAPAPAAPAPAPAAPSPASAPASAPKGDAPGQIKPPAGASGGGDPPKPQSYIEEYEAAIDELDDSRRDPKPPQVPPKGGKRQDAPAVDPPAPDPDAPPAGGKKADEDPAPVEADLDGPEPVRVVELRTAYRQLKKQIKDQLRPEVTKLQGRIKELEAGTGDQTAITTELEGLKKRNQELEQEISFTNYSSSREFQEKYAAPYQEAWTRAVSDFNQLTVRIPSGTDPNTGEPTYRTRQASADDLLTLANMPLSEMDEKAEEMFGRSAARVIRHVERVRDLAIAQDKALADAKKNAGTRKTAMDAQTKASIEKGKQMWSSENKRLVEKYPSFFGPRNGDQEGNDLLTKGRAMADRIFVQTPENRPKTAEEAVRLHALAYNKIANHDRLALRLKQANARISELQKIVDEYEDSNPPAGKGGEAAKTGKPGNYMDDAFAEIDTLDKR